MDAAVLGYVVAVLAVIRGVIAFIQKETVSFLTIAATFLAGVAIAVGHLKF
jgi:hypothetical protein